MADEVVLPVSVDPKGAEDGLKKIEKASTNTADVFKGVLGAAAVTAVIKGAGKALANFAGFFADGVGAAGRQEQAMKDLEVQLSLTGEASTQALAGFNGMAAELELLTGIDDNVILSQAAVAKSFGITNEQTIDLIRAATELSAVTGKGLTASVEELGKTYTGVGGRTATLKGVTDGLTKSQLESGAAINAVIEAFGGTAANRIDTYAGQTQILSTQWANLGENFGEVLIQTPLVTEAVKVLIDFVVFLQDSVKNNQAEMREWVEFGILAAATALSTTVEVIRFFADALNGILTVGALVLTGLGTIVTFLAGVWTDTWGAAGSAVLSLLEAAGIVEEGATEAFQELTSGIVKSLEEATDSVAKFAFDGEKRADAIASTYSTVSKAVDRSVIRIVSAEKTQVGSLNRVTDAREKSAAKAAKEAAATAKIIEAAAKLESEIFKDSETDIQKAIRVRSEFQSKIEEQLAAGIITQTKASTLSQKIETDLVTKLETIRSDADKIAQEALTKSLEERNKKVKEAADAARKSVEEAAAAPVKILVEAAISGRDLSGGELAGVGVGLASSVLEGGEGASKLISQGIGAAADTIVPGIGGAVSALVTQLAKGPEENKKLVKEFVETFPVIIEAIAESMPVIVEALVDSLVNEGGAVRIAVAIAKAMAGEAAFKAIGKQIGLEFGSSFNSANIGGTISKGISQGMLIVSQTLARVPAIFANGAKAIVQGIANGFIKGANSLKNILVNIGELIVLPFTTLLDSFGEIELPEIKVPKLVLPSALTSFTNAIKNFRKVPGRLQPLIDAIHSFTNFKLPSVGGGGGNGPLTGIPGSPLATGGIIGPGFPNDSFPARLSSFERVVDRKGNQDLTNLLSDYNRGALNIAAQGGSDPQALQVLHQIASLLERADGKEIVLKMQGRELARANLKNSQRNARTA